jgi:EmrB/QacA subfamily drug resistance transporter
MTAVSETRAPASSVGRWVLFATVLASSMAFIDGTALNVALPALQKDLQATGVDLLWIINAYALPLASGILVGGSLGDHYGRKRIYMLGISLFAGASLVCGLAPNIGLLIAARAVQGVGGALMVPGSLALICASFDEERRSRAIGLWSTFTALTTTLGPVLGGFLAGRGLWRGIFFINLPLALLALGALVLRVPESRDDSLTDRLDLAGASLATLGLAGLTYGFIEAPGRGWTDPAILVGLLGGLAALAAFVVVERRLREPMVSFRLFRSRTFTAANLLTLFLYGALSVALFMMPLNLIQVQGYAASLAGFALLPFAIVLILLSRWAGGLVDRYGPRLPLTVGPFLVGVGFIAIGLPGLTGGAGDYWHTFLPGYLLLGVGMGITVAPLTTAVMGSVSSNHAGIASGINNAVSRSAGVLAVAVIGAVALVIFSRALGNHTAALPLSQSARAALQVEAAKLGAAAAPAGLGNDLAIQVQTAIRLAFVDMFRVVMFSCAALAWLSGLLAGVLVERHLAPTDK